MSGTVRSVDPSASSYVIVARDLGRIYRSPSGDVIALDSVTFEIGAGDFVFLVGPSGSGKSTLLRLLLADERPDSGSLEVAGNDIGSLPRRHLSNHRARIGSVFQDFRLLAGRTVTENLAFALESFGVSPRIVRSQVPGLLQLVGLEDAGGRFPNELSGGEQQRVAIARALAGRPRLILADEPTGNLDPDNADQIMRLLARINRTGTTVLMATHDRALVDASEHRVLRLDGGRLTSDSTGAGYGTVRQDGAV